MKKNLLLLAALLLLSPFAFSQSCELYFPVEEGTSFEMTSYNPKGKVEGVVKHEVLSKSGSGDDISANYKMTQFDKKGKETFSTDYDIHCEDGVMMIDMRSMLNGSDMGNYEGMEMTVDGGNMAIPGELTPGQTLPDANIKVSFGSGGMNMFSIEVDVTNRKVVKEESLTTPAGTFDCVKITQDVKTVMLFKVEASSADWYNKGAGVVRSESYNKNGKLTGYSELTALNK